MTARCDLDDASAGAGIRFWQAEVGRSLETSEVDARWYYIDLNSPGG